MPDTKKYLLLAAAVLLSGLCAVVSGQGNAPEEVQETAPHKDTTAAAKKSRIGVTGMPSLSFDQSSGAGFGGMGMMFFPIGNKPGTPPSRVGVAAQIATDKSWYAFGFAQLYLFNDRLRLSVLGGYRNSHFQTWVDTGDGSTAEIPYDSKGPIVLLATLVRVAGKLYIGPTAHLMRMEVKFEPEGQDPYYQTSRSNSLGAAVVWDSKDNPYNPSKGVTANLRFSANPSWMGNDSTFNKLMFLTNYYHRFNSKMVLASRVTANAGLGHVPFSSQSYVGNTDLRGYTKGEYRGNQVYTIQSELRWNFYRRWGCVGFFGLAMTVDPVSKLLPGGGGGIRFKILRKYDINAGVDAAGGRHDWGVYFRLTEAF